MRNAEVISENRIQFSLPYDEATQIAAMRFYLKQRWLGREGAKTFAIVTLIMSSIFIVGPLFQGDLTIGLAMAHIFVGFALAFATCCVCFVWLLVSCSRAIRKSMKQLGLKGAEAHYTMTENGVEIEDRVMGGSFSWSEIHSWAEDHQNLMIFRSEHLFYHFPLDSMVPSDHTTLRNYLSKAQVKKR